LILEATADDLDENNQYTVKGQKESQSQTKTSTTSCSSCQASVEAIDDDKDHICQNAGPSKNMNSILEATDDKLDGNGSVEKVEVPALCEETDEQELGQYTTYTLLIQVHIYSACLWKDWQSPIYTFFRPEVEINYVDGHHVHDFTCAVKQCKGKERNP